MADAAIQENPVFENYQNMVKGAVLKTAKMFKLHCFIDDLHSQAFVIFCKALESFDPSIASFSTHLTYKLMGLSTYARKLLNVKIKEIQIVDDISNNAPPAGTNANYYMKTLQMKALRYEEDLNKNFGLNFDGLSIMAQNLLQFCLTIDEEEIKNSGSYKCRYIPMKFAETQNISVNKAREAWEELRAYWNRNRWKGEVK